MVSKRLNILVAAMASFLLVAGCSSGGSGTKSDGTKVSGSTGEAGLIVSAAKRRPGKINVTAPLSKPISEKGTLYFVQCGAPACVDLGDHVDEVAKLIGWKSVRINAGLSPETIKNAWQQVVNENPVSPSGVIASGFPRSIFEPELAKLEARGIPVVNLSVNDKVGGGMTAVIGDGNVRNVKVGQLQAAWTIADSKGKANTVFVRVAGFPTQVPQSEAFAAEYKKLCPSCAQDLLDVPTESMGTTLPQLLASYLQSHPDVDHVVMSYGDMAIGVPAAIKGAGMKDRVRIITDTPNATVAKYISDDNIVVAATAYPGPEMIFTAADIILRSVSGEDIKPSKSAELPFWIMTSETIPSTTKSFPIVNGYKAQFEKLWGLS